jgi:hypothetical protein
MSDAKEVTYFSDGCRLLSPRFSTPKDSRAREKPWSGSWQGWAGTHFSIEKYGARFAERGLVALVHRLSRLGSSDPFISQAQPTVSLLIPARLSNASGHQGENRCRPDADAGLIPIEDGRGLSQRDLHLQGEPVSTPDRIGVWGSSFAGDHFDRHRSARRACQSRSDSDFHPSRVRLLNQGR